MPVEVQSYLVGARALGGDSGSEPLKVGRVPAGGAHREHRATLPAHWQAGLHQAEDSETPVHSAADGVGQCGSAEALGQPEITASASGWTGCQSR